MNLQETLRWPWIEALLNKVSEKVIQQVRENCFQFFKVQCEWQII